MAEVALGTGLFAGFPGIGWVVVDLEPVGCSGAIDRLAALDAEIEGALAGDRWTGEFDLVNGLVGLGVYLLERVPAPVAVRSLRLVVSQLAARADREDGGLAWRAAQSSLQESRSTGRSTERIDLGMAHGVPGVVAFLGRVVALGLGGVLARELLEGAVTWLLRQQDSSRDSRFPFWTGTEREEGDCRSAWCYGDPGVAAAILLAARGTASAAWEEAAVEIAVHASLRDPGKTGVRDSGLCHGAAGLGHVFNRLWQATGRDELRIAARAWFGRALGMRRDGAPYGGFESAWAENGLGIVFREDPTFLTGSAGIALALLAAARPVEPSWDRVLLLSG